MEKHHKLFEVKTKDLNNRDTLKVLKVRAMLEKFKRFLWAFVYSVLPIALLRDERAETSRIVDICIGLFVAGILLPVALVYICNVTLYTGVNAPVMTVATILLPVLGVIGIAMLYMKYIKK